MSPRQFSLRSMLLCVFCFACALASFQVLLGYKNLNRPISRLHDSDGSTWLTTLGVPLGSVWIEVAIFFTAIACLGAAIGSLTPHPRRYAPVAAVAAIVAITFFLLCGLLFPDARE